jgi:DNA-binding beta-propeller fold protein YncE
MTFQSGFYRSILTLALFLAGCDADDAAGPAGKAGFDATVPSIALRILGRYESGVFDESAAEIVDYDPLTQQVFVVNANSGRLDMLDLSSPATPTLVRSLDVGADIVAHSSDAAAAPLPGVVNSVAVSGGSLAVAIEADNKQDNGYVAFYRTDGTFLSAVVAGALPDMVVYSPDGNTVLVANEGEPSGDYDVDPEGSITLVDVSAGEGSVTAANVIELRFTDFNSGGSKSLGANVRIAARAESVAQDLEPEYISVSADSSTAWAVLQENNALAVIDVPGREITAVLGLGFKDHALPGNELDASNRDGGINIRGWPLRGVFMPDGLDSYDYAGVTYLVTANEGDGREYLTDADDAAGCTAQGGFDFDDGDCFHYRDEIPVGDILDTGAVIDLPKLTRFAPDLETLIADDNLGRIKVMTDLGVTGCSGNSIATTGQPGPGCVYEGLYSYGARSFSIWNSESGERVFDSGNDFETITAQRLGDGFNASNDDNEGDARSDDKGPEPEAVEIATLEGRTYAFIALERVGGIMVYDISNPEAVSYVQYINSRDFSLDIENEADAEKLSVVGDLGPESIRFISAGDSPGGEPLLVVGNEVSGTTAIFSVAIVNNG